MHEMKGNGPSFPFVNLQSRKFALDQKRRLWSLYTTAFVDQKQKGTKIYFLSVICAIVTQWAYVFGDFFLVYYVNLYCSFLCATLFLRKNRWKPRINLSYLRMPWNADMLFISDSASAVLFVMIKHGWCEIACSILQMDAAAAAPPPLDHSPRKTGFCSAFLLPLVKNVLCG